MATTRSDSYSERLVKYIPSEVVALYISLQAIAHSSDPDWWLPWVIFGVGLIGCPLFLWRVLGVSKKVQLVLSSVAYLVWVFALGGPFAALAWYKPIYGALLLPIVTFAIPIISPSDKR